MRSKRKKLLLVLSVCSFILISFLYYFLRARGEEPKSIKFGKVEFLPPTITQKQYNVLEENNNFDSSDYEPISLSGSNGFIYFNQCDPQIKTYPLPNSCNMCQAGCGPVSLAMALSNSDEEKVYDPRDIVNVFKNKSLYLGCNGSSIADFSKIVSHYGFEAGGVYYLVDAEDPLKLLRKFLDAGWEEIVLFRHCETSNGVCSGWFGHYVYVTEVKNNSVFALDPYFGSNEGPIDILKLPGRSVKLVSVFIFRK